MPDICAFQYRYSSEEMRRLWSRENFLMKEILVEASIVRGLEEAGIAPAGCWERVIKCGRGITPQEVDEVENSLGHETAALAKVLESRCGPCGKYIHLGATSNDIIDTATALILKESLGIVKGKLRSVIEGLRRKASLYSDIVMVGRTHGQHAVPITLGFKLMNYAYELSRSYERLCSAEERVTRGKLAGAVGTMAAWGAAGLAVEDSALSNLGLAGHPITTQVAPRDGYAELIAVLAILAGQLDRFALEVRELSRPEIGEVETLHGRVGSSTMPHKRNPAVAERVSGIAKLLRGLAVTALENIPLMHERDLTNSSAERIMLPHTMLAIDQMLEDTVRLLEAFTPNREVMEKNLRMSRGGILSECFMVKAVLKGGMGRFKAHQKLSELTQKAVKEGKDLVELIKESGEFSFLNEEELASCSDPAEYLGSYRELMERASRYVDDALRRC